MPKCAASQYQDNQSNASGRWLTGIKSWERKTRCWLVPLTNAPSIEACIRPQGHGKVAHRGQHHRLLLEPRPPYARHARSLLAGIQEGRSGFPLKDCGNDTFISD